MSWNAPAFCAQWNLIPEGSAVLCAVSGGADSMCLLHWLSGMKETRSLQLTAAHYNHRLRGAESDRDEEFVRARCREWKIPLLCGGGDVAAQAAGSGLGLEETAREMRYDFLQRAAGQAGADWIAVAHNADDNAETMLLHLIRGAGLTGLVGMQPRRDNIVRPLLSTTRAGIEEYCALHQIPYVEDSTNANDAYSRNRVRHRVIPELTAMNPRFVEHSVKLLERLREDEACLSAQTDPVCRSARREGERVRIRAGDIAALPRALAPRAVRRLLAMAGLENCSAAHLESITALCCGEDPSAGVMLPGGFGARREYEDLVIAPARERSAPPAAVAVQVDGVTVYGDTGWSIFCRRTVCPEQEKKSPYYVAEASLQGALVLRPRRTGDEIKLPGRGTKSVKKLLIDAKIPSVQRDHLPVLADDAGVLALASFGPDVGRLARPGEGALEIMFQKE